MRYKLKFLIHPVDKALRGSDLTKMANKIKEQNEANEFWRWAWVPILLAFALVVIMLLPN